MIIVIFFIGQCLLFELIIFHINDVLV